MSVALTMAGESLIARLQAEGKPLTIDRFIFADVPALDHTQAINPAQGVPTANVVHNIAIPPEYRAFVNPNQVVYSALLGSDVGPFAFNWQGLFCTEHNTLVAVATFPRLEKRKYDAATNTQGNNLTRNFLLEFTGARELTQITVEAAVWQLDFTVRLTGMDERERLANRDIYGRCAFLDDGWLLTKNGSSYRFEIGRGYVEGIRAALAEVLPVVPSATPCDVWLDVCLQRQGSDMVTLAQPLLVAPGTPTPDYVASAPYHTRHYCVQVARINADGSVTDLRPKSATVLPEQLGVAAVGHTHAYATTEAAGLVCQASDAQVAAGTGDGYILPRHLSLVANQMLPLFRSMMAGAIVEWESETIPTLTDSKPLGLELNGDVVSLATFPNLLRKWCGNAQNATAPAWYRCTAAGVRDAAGSYIKLQDRRGEFARGWDHGRGVDTGRVLGSAQGDAMRNLKGTFVGGASNITDSALIYVSGRDAGNPSDGGGNREDVWTFDASRVVPTAAEFRSRNIATMFLVLV